MRERVLAAVQQVDLPGRRAALLARTAPLRQRAEPLAARLRPGWALLTPLGRGLLLTCVLTWVLARQLGWVELMVVAVACLLALLVSVVFVVGAAQVRATVELEPLRVAVGTPSAGRLLVGNGSRRRLLPMQVDLPVGSAVARFDVPSLGGAAQHEEIFVVPTARRAVVAVGPVSSVQGDPLGLLSRRVELGSVLELYVHPRVVGLASLGTGLLRDLEGQTTRDLSTSDLAFHALRDYEPGDDRRLVHWRSSAKAGKLLVRQFLDTRRSRVTIAVDADTASYRDEDELELAMSVGASIGLRALQDEVDLTLVAGGQVASPRAGRQLLDAVSRAEPAGAAAGLGAAAAIAARTAVDTSLAVLVTGSTIPFSALRAAALSFGPDVAPLVVRVEADAPAGLSVSAGMTVLGVRELEDLPPLLAAAASA